MILFKGEGKKFVLSVTDSNGSAVDPSTLDNVKIWLYNKDTKTVIEKWSIDTETGFSTATIDGNNVLFYLSPTKSDDAEVGKTVIQVSLYDTYTGGQPMVVTKKGLFSITCDAVLT